MNSSDQSTDIVSLLAKGDSQEIQAFVDQDNVCMTEPCADLKVLSSKLKNDCQNILIAKSWKSVQTNFLRPEECKDADSQLQSWISEFQKDLQDCENNYVEFRKNLDSFLQTSETVMMAVKIWLNGVSKLLKVDGDLEKLKSLDLADSQIQELKKIEERFSQCSVKIDIVRNKEYHANIKKVIIPPQINEVWNINFYDNDKDYREIYNQWLKSRNELLDTLKLKERLIVEKQMLEQSIAEKQQDRTYLNDIKKKMNDAIEGLREQKDQDFSSFTKAQNKVLEKNREKQEEMENVMKQMKDNNVVKLEGIDNIMLEFSEHVKEMPSLKKNFHFIFACDESGSMTGRLSAKTRYQAMSESLDKLVNKRADMVCDDIVSIIMFDDKVRRVVTRENIGRRPKLPVARN